MRRWDDHEPTWRDVFCEYAEVALGSLITFITIFSLFAILVLGAMEGP